MVYWLAFEALLLVSAILIAFLRRMTPKKGRFPSCGECGRYMETSPFLPKEMPVEIEVYLKRYELPAKVVRRHTCPHHRRELWIAPPVDDMDKALFVSHTV